MTKNEILDMICAVINDCENNGMVYTIETLNAIVEELEQKLPNEYYCERCGYLTEKEVFTNSIFPDTLYCAKCGYEIDEYE